MKKLLLLLTIAATLQGCRQYCYNCLDTLGGAAGQKCFHTEEEQNNWVHAQNAANPNQPTPCY